jgi:hypothetical protein
MLIDDLFGREKFAHLPWPICRATACPDLGESGDSQVALNQRVLAR